MEKSFYQINTNGNCWSNVRRIKPSRYNIPGMKDALNHLITNYRDNYVVCIKYRQGDTQFGLTETGKIWENNLDDTMIRGVSEELNISISSVDCRHEFALKKKGKNIKVFCLQIENNTDIDMLDNVECTNDDDDKSKKVLVLIHGNKDVIMSKISNFRSSEEDIVGINLIPIAKLNKIYKFLC